MYKLNVTYIAKSKADREQFFAEVKAAGIVEATRNEEGCLRYDYYFSADREQEILLVEAWKDKASQQYHDSLPHLKTLGEIKEKYQIETSFEEV